MATMSGRTRTALMRHQNQLATQLAALRTADRVLSGALAACDPTTQQEMLSSYLEAVQEVRVSLHRLEGLIGKRIPCAAPAHGPLTAYANPPALGFD